MSDAQRYVIEALKLHKRAVRVGIGSVLFHEMIAEGWYVHQEHGGLALLKYKEKANDHAT